MHEITSRGINEEHWCCVKHLLHAEGHLEENIANAVRHNPEQIYELAHDLDNVRKLRQRAVRRVLGVGEGGGKSGCPRCSADLETAYAKYVGKKKGKFDRPFKTYWKEYGVTDVPESVSEFFRSHLYNVYDKENNVTKKGKYSKEGWSMKDTLTMAVGQIGGAYIYDEIGKHTAGTTGTLTKVVGGLLLAILPMYVDMPREAGVALAAAGTQMTGREIYELAKGGFGGSAVRAIPVAAAVRPAQKTYPGSNVQIF